MSNKINKINIINMVLIFYMIFCFFHYMTIDIKFSIHSIRYNYNEYYTNNNVDIKIKEKDDIFITYNVHQNTTGYIHIERIFENKDFSMINTSLRKTITSDLVNKDRKVLSEYTIPNIHNYDCNNYVYSRVYFISNYNLLSFIIPKEFITPRIKICIIR